MKINLKTKRTGHCYIIDNGAYTAKIGSNSAHEPEIIPNCIMKVKSERRRPFIGDQINECRDASGLFYILPFQRGYLVNWDVQKTVWDYLFSKYNGKLNDQPVCITEPIYNFQSNQEAMDEIFFEEFDCCGMLRLTAADLCAYNYTREHNDSKTLLVIDTGYSFTHIVPYIDGVKYLPGIKRIDVGGKILTNHLKEIISYRQLHVMDETYVINQVKEDSCYVSLNFRNDMQQTTFKDDRNRIIREYILPDFSTIKRGYVREIRNRKGENEEEYKKSDPKLSTSLNGLKSLRNGVASNKSFAGIAKPPDSSLESAIEQQTIILNNERITVPEILFHPSDIGIQQMGIAEAVMDSINECPEESKFRLLGNILVTGGNAMFPNFGQRLYQEIRQQFNEHISINVFTPDNPISYPWHGGKILTLDDEFYTYLVTKDEFEEYGHQYIRKHLQNFKL